MEFFRLQRDIPFMRYALIFNIISVVTFVIAVGALAVRGLHLGVDFTGGTVLELRCETPPHLNRSRDAVARLGFTDAAVQNFGTAQDVLVRVPVKQGVASAQLSEQVMGELKKLDPNV